MPGDGWSRRRITRALGAAYADGLLSDDTFAERIDHALAARVVDPVRLVGDLSVRGPAAWGTRFQSAVMRHLVLPRRHERPARLLALDWVSGDELLVGRHHGCDVVLADPSVSRRHARLFFRDGTWVIQDLDSTNGTIVNGVAVGRCALRRGDRLLLGEELLTID